MVPNTQKSLSRFALVGGVLALTLAGCSLAGDKTIFLQCIHEPSNFIMEYKIENEKIWSFMDNKWKEGSDIKFSKSVITYRNYFDDQKKTYNQYTLNRVTGIITRSLDLESAMKFPFHPNFSAKCSIIDENQLKF